MNTILCAASIFIIFGGLIAAPSSAAQVQSPTTLTWQDNSNNEEGFGIEMLSPTSVDFTQIETVGPNISQYSVTLSGNYGETFCFRVFAFNAVGDSSDSNTACKMLPELPPLPPVSVPSTPSGLHSTSVSTDSIRIAWQDVSDETQYVLERLLGNTKEMEIVLAADQTSFIDQDLKRSHTYCYRIAAANNIGLSSFTDYACIETPPQDRS